MACTPQRSLSIGELAASRLDAAALDELLDHIEGCAACSHELDGVAALVGAADEARPARPRSLRPLLWPLLAAAAALVLWLAPRPGGGEVARLRELARIAPITVPDSTLRTAAAQAPAREWRAAMELYRNADWERCAAALEDLRAGGDERALLDLYLGIARAQAGREREAVTALQRAERGSTGLLRQHALWHRAHAHLALGEGPAAIGVLEELVALDEDYAPNARQLLSAVRDALGE